MKKLYAAYGANTNFDSMKQRCPDAEYIGNYTLKDHRLIFRGVADVIPSTGDNVECALWWITPKCERSLDAFEGFPRLYVKKYVTHRLEGQRHRVMLYVMRCVTREQARPSFHYHHCLNTGYQNCGLPQEQIAKAVAEATEAEARRPALVFEEEDSEQRTLRLAAQAERQRAKRHAEESARKQRVAAELARIRHLNATRPQPKPRTVGAPCGTCGSMLGHARNCPDAPEMDMFYRKG